MLYFVLFLVLLLGTHLANKSFSPTIRLREKKLRNHLYAMGMVLIFFSLGTLLTLVIEGFR